jgi:hypothetical protein
MIIMYAQNSAKSGSNYLKQGIKSKGNDWVSKSKILKHFLITLKEVGRIQNINGQIYNTDETGIALCPSFSTKILCQKGQRYDCMCH